jgi:hypothetical protein
LKTFGLARVAVTLIALLAGPTIAGADMMDYEGKGLGWNVKVYAEGTLAHNRSVYAGELKYRFGEVDLMGFCVDLYQTAGDDPDAVVQCVDSLVNGSLAAHLLRIHGPQVTDKQDGAALQLAIWEVINEVPGHDFDVTDGFFSIRQSGNRDRSIASEANSLLASLPTTPFATDGAIVLYSGTRQDVLLPGARASGSIPEPFTMATLALGALCLLLRRRAHPAL